MYHRTMHHRKIHERRLQFGFTCSTQDWNHYSMKLKGKGKRDKETCNKYDATTTAIETLEKKKTLIFQKYDLGRTIDILIW